MKKCISINDAQEGMVLTRAVKNEKGMVLCSKGTPMTEQLINRFKEMQISVLYIDTGDVITAEDYSAALEKIERRFAAINEKDPILGLLKIELKNRLEQQKEAPKDEQ